MRALLAGRAAARTLRAGGGGRVELVLRAGAYVRLGADGWLLLAGPRAMAGPLSLLVAGSPWRHLRPGAPAWVEGPQTLVLGDLRVTLDPANEAVGGSAPPGGRRGAAEAAAVEEAVAAAAAVAGPPSSALRPGLSALRSGGIEDAVRLLAGRGDGLTPAGDDVLAGYAGWAAATGPPPALSALAAGRASPIGLAYLRCAERGELPDAAAATLAAILAGDRDAAARRARVLCRWGSSSGAALLWGMGAGVDPGDRRRDHRRTVA